MDSRPTQCFLLHSSGGSVCTKSIIRGMEEVSFRTVRNNLPLWRVDPKVWVLTLFFWLAISTVMLYCCQNFQCLDYIDQRYECYLQWQHRSHLIWCVPLLWYRRNHGFTVKERWVLGWRKRVTRAGARRSVWGGRQLSAAPTSFVHR